jgi:hypothetical protein
VVAHRLRLNKAIALVDGIDHQFFIKGIADGTHLQAKSIDATTRPRYFCLMDVSSAAAVASMLRIPVNRILRLILMPTLSFFRRLTYLKGQRPRISKAPTKVVFRQTFNVETPDANDIAQVTWVRLASVTHSFDQSQPFLLCYCRLFADR